MGGVVGIADSPLTASGSGTKKPGRYVPVGQGFFIDGYLDPAVSGLEIPTTVNGGPILFKNSQRTFMRESSGNSLFMKSSGTKKIKTEEITDTRLKIRLGFDSTVGAHRQLLVGADTNTTNQFDIGYDAQMFDTNDNDMYWELSNSQFVIQAIPDFNIRQVIPLGLTIANKGVATIKIDSLENIPSNTRIYLLDNLTGLYHNIKNSAFSIPLEAGEYNNRFSLRFTNRTLNIEETNLTDGILAFHSNNYKSLIIKNNFIDVTVNSVYLFNMLGQSISNWDVENEEQLHIQIPVSNVSSGIYIVKLLTTKGEMSKKIIIRQ
jgi:hypothetical protein